VTGTVVADNTTEDFGLAGLRVGDKVEFYRRTWVPWWWPLPWPHKYRKVETATAWAVGRTGPDGFELKA